LFQPEAVLGSSDPSNHQLWPFGAVLADADPQLACCKGARLVSLLSRLSSLCARLQANHDHFVCFDEGFTMFEDLRKAVDCVPSEEDAQCPRECLFSSMPGGHVWGFLLANRVLPKAVLEALGKLTM
jgi:hypothetical protein